MASARFVQRRTQLFFSCWWRSLPSQRISSTVSRGSSSSTGFSEATSALTTLAGTVSERQRQLQQQSPCPAGNSWRHHSTILQQVMIRAASRANARPSLTRRQASRSRIRATFEKSSTRWSGSSRPVVRTSTSWSRRPVPMPDRVTALHVGWCVADDPDSSEVVDGRISVTSASRDASDIAVRMISSGRRLEMLDQLSELVSVRHRVGVAGQAGLVMCFVSTAQLLQQFNDAPAESVPALRQFDGQMSEVLVDDFVAVFDARFDTANSSRSKMIAKSVRPKTEMPSVGAVMLNARASLDFHCSLPGSTTFSSCLISNR